MYKTRHPNCSTSSVLSGIKSFKKCRMATIWRWRSTSWDGFATFTLLYTNIPILPQHNSLPSLVVGVTFCGTHPRIQCATCLVIFTMSLPPQHLLALPCMMTLHWSLLPLPELPIHHPCPYMPHFSLTKTPCMCHCSTTICLFKRHSTLILRQPWKTPALLPFYQIQPPLVQHETLTPPLEQSPQPPLKLRHSPLLFPQPVRFPSRTTPTSWCILMYQISRPRLLLNQCSTIYSLQVRPRL